MPRSPAMHSSAFWAVPSGPRKVASSARIERSVSKSLVLPRAEVRSPLSSERRLSYQSTTSIGSSQLGHDVNRTHTRSGWLML